jgi:hypothetical protein
MDTGNLHTEIQDRRPEELSILPGQVPLCCKISTTDQLMPMKLHLSYATQGDVEIFGSYSNLEPGAENKDFQY